MLDVVNDYANISATNAVSEDLIYVKLLWADARIQWTSCHVQFQQAAGKYGVYRGVFHVDVPTDTFLNTSAWGKGVAIVNGNNLGRYWASEGPQVWRRGKKRHRSGLILSQDHPLRCSTPSTCRRRFFDPAITSWWFLSSRAPKTVEARPVRCRSSTSLSTLGTQPRRKATSLQAPGAIISFRSRFRAGAMRRIKLFLNEYLLMA